MKTIGSLLIGLLLALGALPAQAEEECQALGNRWHLCFYEPFVLEGGGVVKLLLPLYEIPGGVQGAPVVAVKAKHKESIRMSVVGFYPVAPEPYVTVILENLEPSPKTFQMRVSVQGGF